MTNSISHYAQQENPSPPIMHCKTPSTLSIRKQNIESNDSAPQNTSPTTNDILPYHTASRDGSNGTSQYKFAYNVPISNLTSSPNSPDTDSALRDAIFSFIEHLLLYKQATKNFVAPLERAPHCMQAQILCAVYCLYNGKSPTPYLKQCATLKKQKKANLREKWLFQAVRAWFEGSLDQSIEIHTKIAEKYPCDVLSLYLCFNHYVYVHNTEKLLSLFQLAEHAMADDPFFLGMYCFALAEAHEMQAAFAVGQKSYETLPQNPWAHHSLSHAYQELGKYDEGIEFMEKNSIYWEDCIPFMFSHNWWHVAMLYTAKCRGPQDPLLKRIETIIDQYTWYTNPDTDSKHAFNSDITVLAGVLGLLWELDLNGFTSAESLISQDFFQRLWESILPFVQEKTRVHVYPFFDIHFVYALARVGDMERLQEFVNSIEQHGANWNKPYLGDAWGRVLPATSKGVVSFMLGDYNSAFHHLDPVHRDFPLLGGSNPQRLPIDETYVRCCLYHGNIKRGIEALTPNEVARKNGCVTQFPHCAIMVENWLKQQSEEGSSEQHSSLEEIASLEGRAKTEERERTAPHLEAPPKLAHDEKREKRKTNGDKRNRSPNARDSNGGTPQCTA